MAVCRQDMLYKDNTSNLIPTFFFWPKIYYYLILTLVYSEL